MDVPRATYSFRTSFWMGPLTLLQLTPRRSATTRYNASRIDAVAFIVIEVEILSSGSCTSSTSMSAIEQSGTPPPPPSPPPPDLSQSRPTSSHRPKPPHHPPRASSHY